VRSKRHIELLLPNRDETHTHACEHCHKRFKSRNGIWRHRATCKATTAVVAPVTNESSHTLLDKLVSIEHQLAELKAAAPSQQVTNNTQTNQHFHVYLNTHCKNALNMDEFIANATFSPEDFDIFFKKQFYEGAFRILQKQLGDLPPTERPMHCVNPVINKPKTFFIKNEDQWTEETQGDFVYQMKCIDEWQNEEEKMLLTQFFQKFNDKMWDGWKELCAKDERYQRLSDRMRRVTNSDDKMSVLEDLAKVVEWKGVSS
jgi:hypothetical protein